MLPLDGKEYPMDPIPGSTLGIHSYVDEILDDFDTDDDESFIEENEKPTPIDFNIDEKLGGRKYRLTGMVLARDGYYTTIAYVPEKEEWYNFNDEKVRPSDPNLKNLGDDRNVPFLFFSKFK